MDNIKKIYAFNFFWLFSVLLPVLYPYYSSLGISMEQFLQLQAVFGLTVALCDIPTGYFSDRFGRKKSIVIAGLLTGLAYIVLFYSTTFLWLLWHEVILGLALSFLSGADIALLYDSLPAQTSRKNLWKILGRTQMAYAVGESVGAIVCGFLVMLSYRHILIAQLVISWFPFLVALTFLEPKKHSQPIYNWDNVRKMWRHLLTDNTLIKWLSWNFVMWLLATYIVIWLVQRFWNDHHVPLSYFGILWAAYNITMGLSAYFSHYLEKRFRASQLIHTVALLCVMGYFLMAELDGWWGIIAALLLYVGRGINNVVSRDLLNLKVPAELRATANSILNFLFRVIFAVTGPAIGFAIDRIGLQHTLMGIGVVFLLGYMLITRPLLKLL